jgi:2'-5' RNA ligase
VRAFVALPLTPIVRERLARAVSQLRTQTWSEGLRWAPAENLHLTLRFLGEVAETSTAGLLARLRLRLEALEGFHCALAGLFLFPHTSRPRVVAARLSSEPRLPELARAIEAAVVEEGFERESRAFHAHITLARFPRPDRARRQPRGGKATAQAERAQAKRAQGERALAETEAMKSALAAPIAWPDLEVRGVVLYQSVPGPEGVRYRELGSAALACAAGGPDPATRR